MIDADNWSCRAGSIRYDGNDIPPWRASRFDARGTVTAIGADIGADVADFTPPPFDVRSRSSDLPAAAFTDFPLTVLP